jgi:large subunit ribosomal protein L28
MAKCKVTGKKPLVGYKVSHAHNKSKKRQQPNVQTKRVWDETKNEWVRLKVSTRALRTIQKKGLQAVLDDIGE